MRWNTLKWSCCMPFPRTLLKNMAFQNFLPVAPCNWVTIFSGYFRIHLINREHYCPPQDIHLAIHQDQMTGLSLPPMFSTQPLFCLENIGMFWMLSVYCKRTLLFRFEPILFLLVYSIHVGLITTLCYPLLFSQFWLHLTCHLKLCEQLYLHYCVNICRLCRKWLCPWLVIRLSGMLSWTTRQFKISGDLYMMVR
jgi:hypothetical protein